MSLVWEDPPASVRIFNDDVLAELRANPGKWALLREYANGSNSSGCKPPPAGIEVRWSYRGGRTRLYARAN